MTIESEFVHLSRMVVEGRDNDAKALMRRGLRSIIRKHPELTAQAKEVLTTLRDNIITRGISITPIPVDSDSRLELIRRDDVHDLPIEPVWAPELSEELEAVIHEHLLHAELEEAGILATRSLLLIGAPGVGKTLAARWLARQMEMTLFTLDLAAVMSSFLGRTGNNIRTVLDFAQRSPSILLLDEFDAIAKRRDDAGEIGELKRLVTVLLQSIDEWPSHGLLIAASNHPDLLDPAVWRRFDRVVCFPLPSLDDIKETINRLIGSENRGSTPIINMLSVLFCGESFSEVERQINRARRAAIVGRTALEDELTQLAIRLTSGLGPKKRLEAASTLVDSGFSQREASRLMRVARDTIRKHREDSESRAS